MGFGLKGQPFDFDDPSLYSIVNYEQIECAAYTEEARVLDAHIRNGCSITTDPQVLPFHDDDGIRTRRIQRAKETEKRRWERLELKWEKQRKECEAKAAAREGRLARDKYYLIDAKLEHERLRVLFPPHTHTWIDWTTHAPFNALEPCNPVYCWCGTQAAKCGPLPDGSVYVEILEDPAPL